MTIQHTYLSIHNIYNGHKVIVIKIIENPFHIILVYVEIYILIVIRPLDLKLHIIS